MKSLKKIVSILTIFVLSNSLLGQQSFRCFSCDQKADIHISVEYKNEKPISIKYKNQPSNIPLVFIKGSTSFEEGYSTFSESFNELINGKINGKYIFTHSGNWDYIEYIRSDGYKPNFTIELEKSIDPERGSYRIHPCY